MASLKNSKLLFFTTSPRSPIKILDELALIQKFEGKVWDQNAQIEYSKLLTQEIETFRPKKDHNAFTARDRVNRAPKSLGFVDLEPVIDITAPGEAFLSDENREYIFLKQLLKFQLPSPYHQDPTGRFNVHPFLEVIRLVSDLGGLSKTELQIFGLQITNIKKYPEIREKIEKFRTIRMRLKRGRKEFVRRTALKEFSHIYSDEIKSKRTNTRQNEKVDRETFLATKMGNARDYADACFRYLYFSGLFRFDLKTSLLEVKEERQREVSHILQFVERRAIIFSELTGFKKYLFDRDSPALFWDKRERIIPELARLSVSFERNADTQTLKTLLFRSWMKTAEYTKRTEILQLTKKNDFSEIFAIYDSIIQNDSDLIEPNLFLEWNTWRAFVILDDGAIDGNFMRDIDGTPVSTAQGNLPDLRCTYTDFSLVVEVTRSSGQRQYEMEGEPVARHLGIIKRELNPKPAYGIFIPIKLNPASLSHFYVLLRTHTDYYGGCAEIVPFELADFMNLLRKFGGKIRSSQMRDLIVDLIRKGRESRSENEWYAHIKAACDPST